MSVLAFFGPVIDLQAIDYSRVPPVRQLLFAPDTRSEEVAPTDDSSPTIVAPANDSRQTTIVPIDDSGQTTIAPTNDFSPTAHTHVNGPRTMSTVPAPNRPAATADADIRRTEVSNIHKNNSTTSPWIQVDTAH